MEVIISLENLEAGGIDARLYDEFYISGEVKLAAAQAPLQCLWRAHVLGRYLSKPGAVPVEILALSIDVGDREDVNQVKRAEVALKASLGSDMNSGILWPNKIR